MQFRGGNRSIPLHYAAVGSIVYQVTLLPFYNYTAANSIVY